MIGTFSDTWFWLLVFAATAVLLCVMAQRWLDQAWLRSVLLGATSGVCAGYAGAAAPLSVGLAITQMSVQVVVAACVVVGLIVGWFIPKHPALPLVVAAVGLLSFAATFQAIALLYPPRLLG